MDTKLRILLLGPALHAISGISTHLNQLLGSSLAQEFDLFHYQIGSQGRKAGVRDRIVRFFISPLQFIVKLIWLRPTIVHLNTSLEWKAFFRDALYMILARLSRRKILLQVHGGILRNFIRRHSMWGFTIKWLLSVPDAVVLISNREKMYFSECTSVRNLFLVPNAIDLAEYDTELCHKARRGLQKIVYVGRLAEDKGIFDIIEGLAQIWRESRFKNVHLYIAGTGPIEGALKERAQTLGIEDNITFLGALFGEEKVRLWCEADLFIFPTFHEEGLPYTVLESIAAGTPVVTTRIGGIDDVIREGTEGVFVEPHAPSMIASAVAELLADTAKLQAMSQNCVRRAREYYGIGRMVGQFREIYRSIIQ